MANVQIFIPTYNRSKQLKDAVFSCLNQTYKDINVVILDNHSSDDTESLVNNLMQLDNRIRYFKNIENIGMINNFNQIRKYIDADFFCVLTDDDTYNYDFIEQAIIIFSLYTEIEATVFNVPIKYNGVIGTSQLDDWEEGMYTPKEGVGIHHCFTGKHPIITNCLFRRSFSKEFIFESDIGVGSDVYIMWKLFSLHNVYVSKRISSYWNLHGENASLNVSFVDALRGNIIMCMRYHKFVDINNLRIHKDQYFPKRYYFIWKIILNSKNNQQIIAATKDPIINKFFGFYYNNLLLLIAITPIVPIKYMTRTMLIQIYRKYFKHLR